ncbi:MAG: rhodanese-like domain-containing protein [Bacteroidota bacterium]
MKKLSLFIIGLLFIPSLLLTSCDRGDEPGGDVIATPAFELMKDHMISSGLDIDKILVNADGEKFVTGAPAEADLTAFLAKYYIMDIRANDAFTAGHIEGAKNVAFADILTEADNAGGKPILVVCYTGQTACYATALLRLYGKPHTKALKWGMSGWNSATAGSWNSNVGEIADGNVNWSYSAAPSSLVFDNPTLSSISQDGAEILRSRVEQVVADGFKGVSGSDVIGDPGAYFVNNYFSQTDYSGFGHIANAYRIQPFVLADNSYKAYDPASDAKVVTYCYTGQTSAVLTACLRVLGYDAYSLKFGMNGLYNSNPAWSTNQWGIGSSVPKNLPLKQ